MEIIHKKNTAKYLAVPMVSDTSPESFVTGESVTDTAYYKDGAGAWTSLAIADTFTEIGSTGIYEIDLTASEMNHDQVLIKLTSTNGADTMVIFQMDDQSIDDLNITASGNIGIDWANVENPTTAVDLSGTDIQLCDTVTTNSDMRGTDSALLAASAPTNFGDLSITATTGRVDVASIGGTLQTANDNGADINNILADTNELQTDWANGGRLDLILDAILADTGTDGVAISATTANQIADAILNRDWNSVSDTNARTALNALRLLRNRYTTTGGLTVYKEDDSTTAWTSVLTSSASADPITESDPA